MIKFIKKVRKKDKIGFKKKGSLPMKWLFTLNANKRLTADQDLNHEFLKDINDLIKEEFPLSVKLKENVLKNIEINNEKIKFVKKKILLMKEANN